MLSHGLARTQDPRFDLDTELPYVYKKKKLLSNLKILLYDTNIIIGNANEPYNLPGLPKWR